MEMYVKLQLDNYELNLKHNELYNMASYCYMCVWCKINDDKDDLLSDKKWSFDISKLELNIISQGSLGNLKTFDIKWIGNEPISTNKMLYVVGHRSKIHNILYIPSISTDQKPTCIVESKDNHIITYTTKGTISIWKVNPFALLCKKFLSPCLQYKTRDLSGICIMIKNKTKYLLDVTNNTLRCFTIDEESIYLFFYYYIVYRFA